MSANELDPLLLSDPNLDEEGSEGSREADEERQYPLLEDTNDLPPPYPANDLRLERMTSEQSARYDKAPLSYVAYVIGNVDGVDLSYRRSESQPRHVEIPVALFTMVQPV